MEYMWDGMWLPPAISKYALAHDVQFTRTLIAAAIIFITAQTALVSIVWNYRRRSLTGALHPYEATGRRIENLGIAATAVVFLGLLGMGARTWADVQFSPAPANAETVEVVARQFAWTFRYPGEDGRFGRVSLQLVNDAGGNPLGLDESDPAAKDDIVSPILRIPSGRPVRLVLRSHDVIHSFFVRELRIKQDVVPGMDIPLHFTAERPGTYEVPCAELCGLGHHQMRTTVVVMPPQEFESWKREEKR